MVWYGLVWSQTAQPATSARVDSDMQIVDARRNLCKLWISCHALLVHMCGLLLPVAFCCCQHPRFACHYPRPLTLTGPPVVWYGIVSHGMIWNGMVDMVCYCIVLY